MTDLADMAERIAEKHELEQLRAENKRLKRELAVEKWRNLPAQFNAQSDYARRLRREAGMSQVPGWDSPGLAGCGSLGTMFGSGTFGRLI